MRRKIKGSNLEKIFFLQNFFGIKDRKIFLAFTAITTFVVLYVLLMISQQVHPTNWVYSESFEENWMQPEYNATHWKPIQLPFLEVGKENLPAYYRGEIELSEIIKPDITIGVESRLLSVYVNGELVQKYKTRLQPYGEEITLSASLFKPGKNTIAAKIEGGKYRIIGISTEKITLENSKILFLFFLMPALVFLVLGKKNLDSNKTALIVFLILTLIFLKPIFQDFNYWGGRDWDFAEAYNAAARDTILHYHQIPLWNPYVSGGQPQLANPESMLVSLFPVILFDVIAGLKASIVLWYLVGLFGMYMLGKQLKLNTYARYLMAFIFVLSSIYSLRLTVGYALIHCASLTPWTFLFYLKALEEKKYAVLSALSMAFMLFDGGVYMLVYTAILLILYSALISVKKFIGRKTGKEFINPLITLFIVGILCSALGMVKALPMIELSMKYPRLMEGDPGMYRGYTLNYLYYAFLGPTQKIWANDPMADFRSDWDEFGVYIGPVAMLLSLLGIIFYFRREWPMLLITLFGILVCFGVDKTELVLWSILNRLPILSSLGAPTRIILISLFPLSIFAGLMTSKIEDRKAWIALILTVIVFYNLLLVDSPTLAEAFMLAPRTITETRFAQVLGYPQRIFTYNAELYQHFLQNEGVINGYTSLTYGSRASLYALPVEGPEYKGELFFESGRDSTTLKSFSPNRILVGVNTEGSEILALNQNYDKEWKSLDREVYSRKGLIAVNVTKTDKEILFYYSPLSFKIGLMITLLTILLIAHYYLLGKEKQNFKKYLKTLKDRRLIIYAILILFISFYGVDFIQASGLYSEKEVLINGPEYKIPNAITSGVWMASDLGHDLGYRAVDGSWQSEKNGYGYLISGPYVNIQEGAYNITLRIKIDNNKIQDNKVVSIEIARNRGTTLTSKELYIKDFKRSNTYQEFTLQINTTKPLTDVEFRVHYANSPATVNIERVTLTPT